MGLLTKRDLSKEVRGPRPLTWHQLPLIQRAAYCPDARPVIGHVPLLGGAGHLQPGVESVTGRGKKGERDAWRVRTKSPVVQ